MTRRLATALAVAALWGTGLLAACSGSSTPGASPGSATDPVGTQPADGGVIASPSDRTRAVYIASAGVRVPVWQPVSDTDGPGEPVRLSADRAAPFGAGQGDLAYPDLTPDGGHVVVVFEPEIGQRRLYALAIDGSDADSPVEVARTTALASTDRAYGAGAVAYIDADDLYVARLDGSDVDEPVLVAAAPEGWKIEAPHWLEGHGRIAYKLRKGSSSNTARLASAAADGSEATAPIELTDLDANPSEHIAAVLPDERLLVYGTDDRLHVVHPVTSERTVLTPPGWLPSYVGSSADGAVVVVELRANGIAGRLLVRTALDGSDAADPPRFTPDPVDLDHRLVSSDRAAVAWVVADGAQRAVFAADIDGDAASAIQVTDWASGELHVTDFVQAAPGFAGGVLVGSRSTGEVLRFPVAPFAEPVVLFDVPEISNHSWPWPRLSETGAWVTFDANTPDGWRAWSMRSTGGEAVELASPWYRDLLTGGGLLTQDHRRVAAGFATDLAGSGDVTRLTDWHDGEIWNPSVVVDTDGDGWLVYAASRPETGWYAAPTDGSAASRLVMPVQEADEYWLVGDWALKTPPIADGALVHGEQDPADGWSWTVTAWPLDGSEPVTVFEGVDRLLGVDAASQRVLVVDSQAASPVNAPGGSQLWSRAVADEQATLVVELPHTIDGLVTVPGTSRVLVAARPDWSSGAGWELHRVDVAASGGHPPERVASDLPGLIIGLHVDPTARWVFSVHSVMATAVPHPDLLLTSSLDPGLGVTGEQLAPDGLWLWGLSPWGAGASPGLSPTPLTGTPTTGDGSLVLLSGGDGLYAVSADGSGADAPAWLTDATHALGPPRAPDGERFLVGADDGSLEVVVPADPGASYRLTVPIEGSLLSAWWTADGSRVLIYSATDSWGQTGRLWAVAHDATDAEPMALLPEGWAIDASAQSAMSGMTPDGGEAVVVSLAGGDRSLYRVALSGGSVPVPLTPVDDAEESLVGFAP